MRRAVLTVAVVAAAMFAGKPGISAAATVGGEVFGAFNTHGMNDVNDAINAANQSGANFDKISNGITGGLDVRVWPTGNWMFSAGWEPLFLETEDAASGTKMNLDAQSFQATAAYFMPTLMPTKFGFGAGVGMYNLAGEVSDPISSAKVEGSGFGYHAMALGEFTVSPGFAITGAAGYRWANIDIDNSTSTADYTGFMGRAGLAFYLPTP